MPGWLSDLVFNRFAGPGSKNEFYAFAPMLTMGQSIFEALQSFALGKPDRGWDLINKKILPLPEWREWVRRSWFPKGVTTKSSTSTPKLSFADGGFVSRKKFNTGQLVRVGPTALVNELEKDNAINRKFFSTGGFADAFADARANRLETFEWNGNLYNTRRADETDEQYQIFLGNKQEEAPIEIKEKPVKEKENIIIPKEQPIL